MYIGRIIDKNKKEVTFYGKQDTSLTISLEKGMDINTYVFKLADFWKENHYKNYGNAIKNDAFSTVCINGVMPIYVNKNSNFHYDICNCGVLGSGIEDLALKTLKNAIRIAYYEEYKKTLLEAKAYFKELEKNASVSVTIPISCTTMTNVLTPKLQIDVNDDRTHIYDCSYGNSKTGYKSLNTRDFSHILDIDMFDDNYHIIHIGLENFADAWPEIKEAIKNELEKQKENEDFEME